MFFWVSPRRQIVVCRRFGTLCQFHLQRLDVEPLKMELIDHNLTPGRYPKEHIQHSRHSESLKSRIGKHNDHSETAISENVL